MKQMKIVLTMLGTVAIAMAAACGGDGDDGGDVSTAPKAAVDVVKKDMENPKYGGTIKVMSNQATPSLDPVTTSTGGTSFALNWVYEKLFVLEGHDSDLGVDLVGQLAQSSGVSSDLLTYTIKLRQGIRWQNIAPVSGREFEARDVVCSYQGYMQPTSVLYGQFNQVQSIEATDKYTVVVKLKEPNAQFIEETNSRSERIFPCDLSAEERRTKAIGTGPFIIKEFTPGATGGVKAERNPNYWQKDAKGRQLPYLDGYEYIANAENASKIAGLRSGQLQAADNLSKADVDALKGSNPNFIVATPPALVYGTFSIVFKSENPPWNDQRVRCAVSKAIDKDRLSDLRNGEKGALAGPFPWSFVSDEPLTLKDMGPCYQYDPEGAKKLLAEAGYGAGGKKIVAERTYGHAGDNTTAENAAYQQMLAAVGIEMKINRIDYGTYATGIYRRDFVDFGAGFNACGSPVALYPCAAGKFAKDARYNFSGITNADTEAILKEIKVTTDKKRMQELARKLWDKFFNEAYESVLPSVGASTVFTPNVRNVYVRDGISSPFISDCNTCRFAWLSDAPRTSASAAEEQGGSDREPATVQLQATAERKTRVVRS